MDKYIRFLKRQIVSLRRKLEKERVRRDLFRKKRLEENKFIVSLAGYTAAGKTTLFNALTDENKPVTGKLFTTLTTTARKMKGYEDIIIIDTVGFIERLPHFMIESFKSTLEELQFSDVILLVLDYSLKKEEFLRKYKASLQVLNELGVDLGKVVLVLNKIDLKDDNFVFEDDLIKEKVEVSALKGTNLDKLKEILYKKYLEAKNTQLIQEKAVNQL